MPHDPVRPVAAMIPEAAEPDRYELREPLAYQFSLNRRRFLEVAGTIIWLAPIDLDAAEGGSDARIHTAADGTVTVYSGKVEMGQGARTEIAMAVAEELKVPLERVRVVLGDTELCPNDGITAGSRTTPSTLPAVRKAAREKAGREQLVPPAEWKTLGTPHGRIDAKEIVTGVHQYPSDIQRPNMQYGCVLRAPAYNSTLSSIDVDAVKSAKLTVVRDGNFVACVAPTSFEAREAVKRLAATAKWEQKPHPSSDQVFSVLKATAEKPREQKRGDLAGAFAQAKHRLRATYRVPYIQHAPMEPRAAVAEWSSEGKLTVWTATQNPFGVRSQLQQAFRLTEQKVRVIVPDSGGGFGGKHTGECAIEAARMAKEAGCPVWLRWSRAEEFMWAYFRPAGLYELEAGVDAEGRLVAWDFNVYNAGMAGLETPYRVENARSCFYTTNSPMREGSYRGIAATANNFARECFMDELAAAAGKDPLEFHLMNLENERIRNVLHAVTEKFGWTERRKNSVKPRGVGLACGMEKGSVVAACAEVEVSADGKLQVRDFHMAYECGAILNPVNLKAQVMGSIIQGLGGALTEEIRFAEGKLINGSFAQYKVPRFRDVPPITVTLVDRKDLDPVGAGETPIIAVAPAIAAALAHATGERTRAMPVRATRGNA